MTPSWTRDRWVQGNWNAYVLRGSDKAERAARLQECPEAWRAAVKAHVTCAFQCKAEAARRQAKAAGKDS